MVVIKGVEKNCMVDYPGKMCTTIFTSGCNMKCPFCQNPDLITSTDKMPDLDEDKIIEYMKKNKKWIDGVTITGGEPLLHKDIGKVMKKFKDSGFLVKLDTNGLNPELLKELIGEGIIDYIAMDIKSDLENYSKAAGVNLDIEKIKESVSIIMNSKLDYEFRSTVVPDFFSEDIFKNISNWLKGAKKYYLQQFRSDVPLLDKSFEGKKSYSGEELDRFKEILSENISEVGVRK